MPPSALLLVDPLAALLALVLVGAWVYLDAAARGSESPAVWGALCALFLPAVLLYLWYRSNIGERSYPMGRREVLVGIGAIAVLTAIQAATITAPPEPYARGRLILLWLPIGVVVGAVVFVVRGVGFGRREEPTSR